MKKFIEGNTYPVKDRLKAVGCRFDGKAKMWYAESESVLAQANAIMQGPTPLFEIAKEAEQPDDPAALAARYGRQAVAGAKVAKFSCYGLGKSDSGLPNGSIRMVKGKRYVQVARTARHYLSRDMLEDFDIFDAEPGGSYSWDGVEVTPTAEELAADADAKGKRAAVEGPKKRRREIVALVKQYVNSVPDTSTMGMTRLWGDCRSAGSETMYGDGERLVYIESSCDDGPHYWSVHDAALAAEAITLKTK